MPLGRQVGFVFTGGDKGEESKQGNIAITLAHELGHGVYQIQHPWEQLNTQKTELSTNSWLMSYGQGIQLPYIHWEQISHPKFIVPIFKSDASGEMVGAKPKLKNDETVDVAERDRQEIQTIFAKGKECADDFDGKYYEGLLDGMLERGEETIKTFSSLEGLESIVAGIAQLTYYSGVCFTDVSSEECILFLKTIQRSVKIYALEMLVEDCYARGKAWGRFVVDALGTKGLNAIAKGSYALVNKISLNSSKLANINKAAARVVEKAGVKGIPALRLAYVSEVEGLSSVLSKMKAAGSSSEEIARTVHRLRRELGVKYKSLTPDDILQQIYQRNLQKYGDKLGPTIDYLRIKKGYSWEEIIERALKTGGQDLGF